MKQLTEPEMLHRMAAYCSSTERCSAEVERKILAGGLPPEAAARILERLIKEKFIDDRRYCRSFVNDKLCYNKWGRIKIGYELRKKNIPVAISEEILASIDEEEYTDILLTLLKAKLKSIKSKDERDTWNKLFRFAAGRGYESSLITQSLKTLLNEGDYQDFME
ncbi:MAG: RecX family transcriptional regulator [Tannerellaceae bacterium]|nr:RecX family transcriptional regulator [Tannerellaceae bacterium]MCD8263907.1 RecX family transcriptional regulator [Tannerellaceae bacterium]